MNVDRDRNMALKPSYNDKLYLPGLSNTEILILALEASQKLEWNIEEVTPEGIRFEVPFSIRSHGEAITFTIEKGSDGEVSVRSQSSSVQFVDYGKNRKNIQKLRETMEEIKASLTPEAIITMNTRILMSIRMGVAINPLQGMKKDRKEFLFFSSSM